MTRLYKIFASLNLLTVLSFGLISVTEGIQPKESVVDNDGSVHESIIYIGTNYNGVMEHLSHLTNRIGPRPSGSENLHNACIWARDMFASFGLTNVHMEECTEIRKLFFASKRPVPTYPSYNIVADIQR